MNSICQEIHIREKSGGHTVAKSQFLFQKIKFSIIPFLAGKFKFNVGVDFIKIEFLNKN